MFTNPLPTSLSPSRLADFESCPRKFQYASVERIPQPTSYVLTKGNFVHKVLELLYALAPAERTRAAAEALLPTVVTLELTDEVRADLAMDDAMESRMLDEARVLLDTYFTIEDPTTVATEGVELWVVGEIDGVPLRGIIDRLDREADGSLTIVDYKTGSAPRPGYESSAFAATELYAALCQEQLGETPARIRLLYLGARHEELPRVVSPRNVNARKNAAVAAWGIIQESYARGSFTAKPSANACRFCAFKERCRDSGVRVVGGS